MNTKVSLIIKLALTALILFLIYALYNIIQEPIQFEELKKERYTAVKTRLEKIRDAQKAHREIYGDFAGDFDKLIAFIDTGKRPIIERKDSSFMYYNERYQQEMSKDTIITKILGYEDVKQSLYSAGFDPSTLRTIPYSNNESFEMAAGKLEVNQVIVPVFEAKASNKAIFHDVLDKYDQYIEEEQGLAIGSLTEPTLSGNWK